MCQEKGPKCKGDCKFQSSSKPVKAHDGDCDPKKFNEKEKEAKERACAQAKNPDKSSDWKERLKEANDMCADQAEGGKDPRCVCLQAEFDPKGKPPTQASCSSVAPDKNQPDKRVCECQCTVAIKGKCGEPKKK